MLYFIFLINTFIFAFAMKDVKSGSIDFLLLLCVISNLLILLKIALMDQELKQYKKQLQKNKHNHSSNETDD